MNLHLNVTDAEFRRIVRQAGKDATVIRHSRDGNILFATVPVTLFVSPTGRYRKEAVIHDPTYSKDVMRIQEKL